MSSHNCSLCFDIGTFYCACCHFVRSFYASNYLLKVQLQSGQNNIIFDTLLLLYFTSLVCSTKNVHQWHSCLMPVCQLDMFYCCLQIIAYVKCGELIFIELHIFYVPNTTNKTRNLKYIKQCYN